MIFSRTLVFIAFSIISTALSLPSTLQQNSSDTSTFDQTCAQSSFTVASDDNGLWPYRKYRSTNVTSPTMKIERSGESVSDGLIFLGLENSGLLGYPGVGQPRVEIFTDDGDLVWAGSGQNASNFRKQTLNGKPVIHYFVGSGSAAAGGGAAHGCGRIEILDENYETLHNVCPKLDINYLPGQSCDCPLDVHESYITENNTMVCTVYNITQTDLSSVGGPRDGWVYDSLAVEIDIETNEALWIWSALHSVPISSSHNVINSTGVNSSQPYDWFHMNSIFPFRDGFFVNSRETWSSYYVNRNGTVEWELNGLTGGSFGSLPEQAHFVCPRQLLVQYNATDPFDSRAGNITPNYLRPTTPTKSSTPTLPTTTRAPRLTMPQSVYLYSLTFQLPRPSLPKPKFISTTAKLRNMPTPKAAYRFREMATIWWVTASNPGSQSLVLQAM